jgi:predicted nucleic acid-binding protein/GNAT superfamily N-acetyltransferase
MHSKTLGFLPEGGFRDHAKKKWIVIAVEKDDVLGYLLFRYVKKNLRISITHLCVKEEFRGRNISSKLIDQLKDKFQSASTGISLSCRQDYDNASKLWERYGFIRKNVVRSRSLEENYLVKWWYDFNHLDLFQTQEKFSTKLKVLLDANILIKLRDIHVAEYNEVKSLMADWLIDEVDYYYAQEMYNEICRDKSKERAKKTRLFITQNFHELKCDQKDCKEIEINLKKIFSGKSINDKSDRKQLSECIASGFKYFVTGDGEIRSKKSLIKKTYDVLILSPLEFILEIDQLQNSSDYYPMRLSGSIHQFKKVGIRKLEILTDKFLEKKSGEIKADFNALIESVLKDVKNSSIKTVTNPSNQEIAFWGLHKTETIIEIPFLRVASEKLGYTLFTQLIYEIIDLAIEEKVHLIKLKEKYISEENQILLGNMGFYKQHNIWLKTTLNGNIESKTLTDKFPVTKEQLTPGLIDLLSSNDNSQVKQEILYKIERQLFPLKFSDLNIPCYIIPIKPHWASQLFDKISANQMIFGALPEKIWNRENVYFRNVKPVSEMFPARILWYASSEKNFPRQSSIVATSYLDEVTVDKVKNQFRKYKKYGIYDWSDIYKLAKNDIKNDIKAIVFSDTEVFRNAITFQNVTEILLSNGYKKNTFTSPLKVDYKIFNSVYKLAKS